MYTREECYEKTLEYFNGDELATDVFLNKYCLKDKDDNYYEPTPWSMHKRLANEFARVDIKHEFNLDYLPSSEECWLDSGLKERMEVVCENYFDLFDNFKYVIPQGSPMCAIGNPFQVQSASNCFVINSPLNSYGGILTTDQELVQLAKRRGGIGFDISTLAPKGTPVNNAARSSTGMASFMHRFSNSTREVAQNGRRGALMLTCNVHHYDIEDFIKSKMDLVSVTGANISLMVTDEFMTAVKENKDYEQRWPVNSKEPKFKRKVSAKKIWNLIMECAHASAEPGVIFIDNYHKNYPAVGYLKYRVISTNPCSEIGMGADDSCRLLAQNIFSYIVNPFTKDAFFDFRKFEEDTKYAMRLADNLIDLEIELIDKIIAKVKSDPEPEVIKQIELNLWKRIKNVAISGRRAGLGITGLGDALAALGHRYGSQESIKMVDFIFKTFALSAYQASIDLAEERGAFPDFDFEKEKDNAFLERLFKEDPTLKVKYLKYGRRNVCCLTVAPTGSLSTQTQTTSGIEPAYMCIYKRRRKIMEGEDAKVTFVDDVGDKWTEYNVYHHNFKKWMEITGHTDADYEKSPYYKSTAMDVDWRQSVEIQATAQKWIDHSISKTCNLPSDASVELVSEIYMRAWESGCKGFTIYRDGSRSGVLVSTDDNHSKSDFQYKDAYSRDEFLDCEILTSKVKGKDWAIIVGTIEGKPYEIFGGSFEDKELFKTLTSSSKKKQIRKRKFKTIPNKYDLYIDNELVLNDIVKQLDNPNYAVMTRLISLSLRHGAKPSFLAEQLRKDPDSSFDSFSKVLARCLKNYIEDGTPVSSDKMEGCNSDLQCKLVYQDGCVSCIACGLSKCN